MKLFLAIVVTLVACSRQGARPAAPPSALRLSGSDGRVVIQLAPDDRFLDAASTEIGRYDAAGSTVIIGGTRIALAEVVKDSGDAFTVGDWHVTIAPGGDVTVDKKPFGHLDGSFTTPQGQRRARALMAAVPMLPRAQAPSRGPGAKTAERPPPPPPPPPPHG